MKAAVLGVGKMGQVICYAMHELGFNVVGIDSNENAGYNFRKYIKGSDGSFYLTDKKKTWDNVLAFEKPDIVISSLPYHQTEKVAFWCIDKGIRYCDLGGRVDVSYRIGEYADKNGKKPVFTDLGLAPGWANILAEYGYRNIHRPTNSIKMMVGGLPSVKVNEPFNYVTTWSVDGLINEYEDDCEVLRDGEIKIVKGMSELEIVNCGVLGELEAFCTSGGASHTIRAMRRKGVKNCSYKTLRYKGHRDVVRFLLKNQNRDCVREVFEKGCKDTGDINDIVLIKVFVNGGDVEWKREIVVFGDLENFSAMQKATAFPVSCVASLMAEGFFDKDKEERRGYWEQYPKNLSYVDVPYDEFSKRLNKLGLDV